MLNNRKLAARM
jgi:hypothetical protein